METRNAASDISGTGVLKVTAGKPSSVTSGAQGRLLINWTGCKMLERLSLTKPVC